MMILFWNNIVTTERGGEMKKLLGLCGNPQLVFNRNGESPVLFGIFCMRTCGYIPKSQSEHLLPKSG